MPVQFDLENERAIIVSALVDEESRRMAIGSVQPEDFLGERFRVIFEAIGECHRKKLQLDVAAIASHAGEDDFGGMDFLQRMFAMEPAKNLSYHLARQRQDAARMKLKKIEVPELDRMLADRTIDHAECLQKIAELKMIMRVGYDSGLNVAEKWCDSLDRRCSGELRFQSTGYPGIDDFLTDGYGRKLVSLIAARTRNGKTTMVVDTVRRMLELTPKPKIAVLPNEIGQVRFVDKLVSSATLTPTVKLRKNPKELTLAERDDFKRMAHKLVGDDDRLSVLDNPFFTLPQWTNDTALEKLEEILAEGNYDVVFIDLFQRILTDLRPASIEMALVKVQHMAKLYDTHMCLVHQISRKAEERKDKRPELGDLKGSGGYEEIPDLILLLHRARAYKQFRKKDEIEISISKQREGEAGVTLVGDFYPMVSRIEKVQRANRERAREEESEGDDSVI